MASSAGLILGRYRILRPLARGGMGVIYLARVEGAAGFSRPVAVKRVSPDRASDPTTSKLFVREARILAQLSHPNIVNVIDFGEEEGDYVMVLEYVRGYHLGAWHRYLVDQDRELPVAFAIYIISHVLDALEYAHTFKRADGTATPVIHRDVSPANVLLDTRGNVKLLDFGIARIEGGGEYRTRDGTLKGKLPFTAPEVFSGHDPTEQSDIYSAGVLLYMLLAGQNPFRASDAKATVGRVLTHTPPLPSAINPKVSEELDAVVMRAMARSPSQRYASAGELASELRKLLEVTDVDLRPQLGELLDADFSGDMPEQLGLTRLDVLDEASAVNLPVDLEDVPSEATDTIVTPVKITSAPPSEGKRRAVPWALIVLGLSVVAIAVGVVISVSSSSKPSQVIVIQKESAGGTKAPEPGPTTSVAPAALGSDTPTTESANSAAKSPSPAVAAPRPKVAEGATSDLTQTFRARQALIESCFTKHAADVEGAPQITIRFTVAPTGAVESAALSPPGLSATPLGQCLSGVARATRFEPRVQKVSFSIPITARRVQR